MIDINKGDVGTKVTADILSKIIWLALSPAITAFITLIVSIFKKIPAAIIISAVSLVISIIALVMAVVSLHKKSKGDRSQSSESIEPKFKASSIEAEFYFVSREEMESRIEYDMQLTCSSMREYPRDLLWSGAQYYGTSIAPEYAEDYAIEEQIGPQSPHDYLIIFKTEKKLGDTVKFKTITKVGDTTHIMKNSYSYTITYQVEELILRISAPKGLIKDVKKAVYADRGRELIVNKPTKIPKKIVGNLEEYTFTCNNPTLLYNYFIEWQFTKP